MRKSAFPLVALALLVSASLAFGQIGMGELKGYVTDEQGAALPNAHLVLSSPALMGERTAESNESGFYRFINLPPGTYTLAITKENYKKVEHTSITISSGKVTGLNVTLEVGDFETVITIVSDAPLIDMETAHQKVNISGELQRALPTTVRSNFSEILRVAPGAVLVDPNRPQYSYYSVSGASAYYENNWVMDGARMNQWEYSYMSTRINLEAVEDAEVGVAGSNAANPIGQGGVVNLTTKSGGNEFHGSGVFRYQPSSWNDNNIEGGTSSNDELTEGIVAVGGYLIKDKIWFFGTGRFTEINEGLARTADTIATATAAYSSFSTDPIDKSLKDIFIKGTFMPSDDHQLSFSYQRDWGYETYAFSVYDPSAYIDEGTVGPMFNGTWNWFINDHLSLYTQGSFFDKDRDRYGRNRDSVAVRVYDDTYISGGLIYGLNNIVQYGNYGSYYEFEVQESLINLSSTASYFLDDFYGTHDFKIGVYAQPQNKNQMVYYSATDPWRQYYVLSDPNDASSEQILFYQISYDESERPDPEITGTDYAFFVNDTWRPTERMTIEWGLRTDFISQSEELEDYSADGYISTMSISPNIGLNYAMTEDRKNIMRASYSIRSQNYTAESFSSSGLGIEYGYTEYYDTDLDGTFDTIQRVDRLETEADDASYFEDIGLGYSHDITLGYSRELPWQSSLTVDYTYRQFRNMLTSYNINPIIEDGQFVGVINPTKANGYWYVNLNNEWNWVEYQSINLTFSRVIAPVTVLASLMYEHGVTKGEWSPYDYEGYIQPEIFDNYSGTGGSWGEGDRGLSYRINLSYMAPYGINLGLQIIGQSGPRSGALYTYLDSDDPEVTQYGDAWVLQDGYYVYNPLSTTLRYTEDTRADGQWRSSMMHLVNVRIAKDFKLVGSQSISLAFDVFNLFNAATSLEPDDRGLYDSTYYGDDSPYDYVAARSAQMMIRYAF